MAMLFIYRRYILYFCKTSHTIDIILRQHTFRNYYRVHLTWLPTFQTESVALRFAISKLV